MEFREVVRRRRMVRTYADRVVARALVDAVVDAGLRAPSAGFTQGAAFVVLEGLEATARFWAATARSVNPPEPGTRWARMRTAPVVIVVLTSDRAYRERYAEADKAGVEPDGDWPLIDAGFAVMSMLLAATDCGLGSLYFSITHGEKRLLADLGVPSSHRTVGAVTLGWPADDDHRSPSLERGRRPRTELVRYGSWGSGRL